MRMAELSGHSEGCAHETDQARKQDQPADVSSNGVRKSIARVLTVINSKQRQNLREFYKNKKCMFGSNRALVIGCWSCRCSLRRV